MISRSSATTRPLALVPLFATVLLPLAGCSQITFDLETVKEKISHRPPQLEALSQLEGRWTTSGTVEFIGMDEPIQTEGSTEARWECDGRILVDRSSYSMGPLGQMTGVSIWTWDDARNRYSISWFDSFGETATGHGRYDEATRTWHFQTKGRSSLCDIFAKGTIRVVDADTLEWTYDQWDSWRIMRFSKMYGKSERAE